MRGVGDMFNDAAENFHAGRRDLPELAAAIAMVSDSIEQAQAAQPLDGAAYLCRRYGKSPRQIGLVERFILQAAASQEPKESELRLVDGRTIEPRRDPSRR
jgi:hypothetical protein